MRQIYMGKPVKDVETAAESIADSSLSGNIMEKFNKRTSHMTVTEHMNSEKQIDDCCECKSHFDRH